VAANTGQTMTTNMGSVQFPAQMTQLRIG